ncbi:MAG: BLUF domain-containing protein [Pseudomonadota bacterium]
MSVTIEHERPAAASWIKPKEDGLVSLLYTSRSTIEFTRRDLKTLVARARRSNLENGVTGSVLYEHGRFVQWLEGPAPEVQGLFDRIGEDSRHTDIEVVSYRPTFSRVFGDWGMQLLSGPVETAPLMGRGMLRFVESGRRPGARRAARGLITGLYGDFDDMLAASHSALPMQISACEDVFEAFGELWAEDACADAEISIGLCALLKAFRRFRERAPRPLIQPGGDRLLVAAMPGEQHFVGAAVAAESLIGAGRRVNYALPESSDDICRMLDEGEFSGLALASSPIFSRSYRMRAIEEVLEAARRHAPGEFQIVLYGRMAPEMSHLIGDGACDAGCCCANDLDGLFSEARDRAVLM